jgi:crotonobetainyl-CoA:carnitine CoA-transferase CaiB-like acyl-CoA transferase
VVSRRGARGPLEKQFDRRLDAHAQSRRLRERTRGSGRPSRRVDCCLEPVLELDEALDSELVRAREMVVELDQTGATHP